jgi:hypothetical protein
MLEFEVYSPCLKMWPFVVRWVSFKRFYLTAVNSFSTLGLVIALNLFELFI